MQYVPHVSEMAEHVPHGPNEGTLMVNPLLQLPTAYVLPRPLSRRLAESLSTRHRGLRFRIFESRELDVEQ
jgi:hypothetical protein